MPHNGVCPVLNSLPFDWPSGDIIIAVGLIMKLVTKLNK
jgi:hypothetical protein